MHPNVRITENMTEDEKNVSLAERGGAEIDLRRREEDWVGESGVYTRPRFERPIFDDGYKENALSEFRYCQSRYEIFNSSRFREDNEERRLIRPIGGVRAGGHSEENRVSPKSENPAEKYTPGKEANDRPEGACEIGQIDAKGRRKVREAKRKHGDKYG